MHFNPFISEKTYLSDIKSPNIPSWLTEQYGQCGEDVILLGLLKALIRNDILADPTDMICVEIGANHAYGGSTTYLLEQHLKTSSILVEANPSLIADIKKARPEAQVINIAITDDNNATHVDLYCSAHNELSSLDKRFVETWHEGQVGLEAVKTIPALTPNALLDRHLPKDKTLLFLSFDVEGLDLRLAQALDFNKWRPLFLQMEPSDHYQAHESDAMISHMHQQGYVLIAETNVNLLFVDKHLLTTDQAPIQEKTPTENDQARKDTSSEAPLSVISKEQPENSTTASTPIASSPPLRLDTQDVLDSWSIDNGFVEDILSRLGNHCILSLDIFDTALTRGTESPVDLFAAVEHRLVSRFGKAFKGFARYRQEAEQQVRHLQPPHIEDITYAEIYAQLEKLMPWIRNWDEASCVELEVEGETLRAVPDILALTQRVTKAGGHYIFVSDMYLPKEALAAFLNAAGYRDWTALYVSSELRRTKATGNIWSLIQTDHPLNQLLHMGDDIHSDVKFPATLGIQSCYYARARSARRTGAKLTPAVLPFSLLQRRQLLEQRKLPNQNTDNARGWYGLGRSLGTVVIGAFVKWLAERVRQHGIERLYFCARDGHLMQQAWETAGFAASLPVETRYIYVSRATLNLPAAIVDCSRENLSDNLLNFLSSSMGSVSLKTALERAELQNIDSLALALRKEFGSLETLLDSSHKLQRFEYHLQQHASAVYDQLHPRYEQCVKYLRQEGLLDDTRNAIVDMGWNATMQRSLAGLIRFARGNDDHALRGFYYGLWPHAGRNRYLAGPLESCFASEFQSYELQSEVHQSVAILEELHGTRHGTTIAYAQGEADSWHPVFKQNQAEEMQYDTSTLWFQKGVVEGIKALYSETRNHPGLTSEMLTPDAGIAALGAVFLSPTEEEVRLLSELGHCPTFDHAAHVPMLSARLPPAIDDIRSRLMRSDWAVGQMKLWWINANPNERSKLREVIHHDFSFLGHAVLQQFQ